MIKKILGTDKNTIGGVLEIVKFRNGKEISRKSHHNLVVNSSGYGKNIILRQLSGDDTYAIDIASFCAGSSNQAVSELDTDLIALVMSGISITDYVISGSQLIMNVFVTDAEMPNGTYREFGFKTSGNRLFSRIVPAGALVKSAGEDILFIYTLGI